jgi:hypothetical protein
VQQRETARRDGNVNLQDESDNTRVKFQAACIMKEPGTGSLRVQLQSGSRQLVFQDQPGKLRMDGLACGYTGEGYIHHGRIGQGHLMQPSMWKQADGGRT